jgi:endonuclease/exonuclease/phosphatase family metal-dependent hydrolase
MATNKDNGKRPSPTLEVMTYNIHKGFSPGNTRFVLHQIRDALKKTDADLVFLQEIQGRHTYRELLVQGWPDSPQFEFLAGEIWPHHAYGKNAIYNAGDHGNAILSKYPFVFWENINVSFTRRASRSVLHGIIEVPEFDQPVHVMCIHFDLIPSERRRQLNILSERIRSHIPQDAPLILAGDFNDWAGQAERHMSSGLGLTDVFMQLKSRRALTYPVWFPILPVDRIFYRGAKPRSCECLTHLPWRRLSDHAALHASFSLE